MKIREMVYDDAKAVHQLDRDCGLGFWSLQSYQGEVHNPVSRYLVIEDEGKIIGFLGMWLVVSEAQIMNVAIHPDYQGHQLGTVLMKVAMGLAAKEGCDEMTLEVKTTNTKALKLYEKLGFEVLEIRKYYYKDNSDAILMRRGDLE